MNMPMAKIAPVSLQPPIANVAPSGLLQGEKAADYEALLARITATLRPADIFEEIYEQRALARRQRAICDFQALALEDAAKNFCGTKPMGENAMNSVKRLIADAKV